MIEGQRRNLGRRELLRMMATHKYFVAQFVGGWGLCNSRYGGMWAEVDIER